MPGMDDMMGGMGGGKGGGKGGKHILMLMNLNGEYLQNLQIVNIPTDSF